MTRPYVKTWKLFWAPEGRHIATVRASTPKLAKSRAPLPYRKFKGEIYVEEVKDADGVDTR